MTGPAYRTISDVATLIGVPQHVLRFWESKFPAIAPLKRGGNRRYYRPEDVALIERIARLLHVEGYTIKGAQKLLGAVSETDTTATAPVATPTAPATFARSLAGPLRAQISVIRADLAAALDAARGG